MKVSRREFSRNCALAASAAALGETMQVWAQVQGEHIQTTSAHPVRSIQDTETPAEKDERMQWFREARFGMFIHWGLYAIPAGRWDGKEIPGIGEWIMNSASIPVARYKALGGEVQSHAIQRSGDCGLGKVSGDEVHRHYIEAP